MGGGQGGLPLQDNHRSERISVWARERKRRTNHADSYQNQPRKIWRDSLSARSAHQTSEEGSRDKKKDTAATGRHNAFLTGRITPFAPDFWHKYEHDGSPVNLTTPDNFNYLYQSALNYAGLMGIKLPSDTGKGAAPSENHRTAQGYGRERAGVCQSGRERRKAPLLPVPIPRLAGTRIVLDSHRLYGTASRIIEEHCQEFVRQFVRHHGVCNVTEAFCYDFAIEELEDWENRDSDASPKEIRANRRLADSYQSGKRAEALKRMSGKPFCNSLEEAVRNYRAKREGAKLLELIRRAWH